ncbi:hypothetical protein [Paraburkholderia atlantica]|uniref:hypothetical protein n=1 Tax=Paraburkholderia atlantica TaxID=2654982 RepID=UPI0016206A55|nr:hypothetical protein [Paraburkholderia atlantica]MBB5421752.1 hypothetical protein [Paraburkholderia atlantica]
MLPDGIFDNAIYNLRIAAHFTNMSSGPLTNVTVYLESVGDPGIVPVAQTFTFATIPAGASVIVGWNANFQNATPGKRLVSFIAKADGFDARRSIQQIFVSQTRYSPITNTYTCTVEEGALTVSKISAISPAANWSNGGSDCCKCGGRGGGSPMPFPPYIPTGATMVWTPNPAYSGVHGDLPFSDPWWKILAIIVAIVAAIVAIVAAAVGAGQANFSVGGTFDETQPSVHCCTLKGAGSGKPAFTVAGVASAIASGAIAVACSDTADPFFRGQAATPPAPGEMTVGEQVVVNWELPEAPNAGVPYPADVKWTYTRFTTSQTYSFSVTETQTNVHVAGDVEVDTPSVVHAFEPLWVKAKFQKGGGYFSGAELYAFALFQAPLNGLYFVVNLSDDGLGFDTAANDGIFSGGLNLELARRLLLEDGEDVYGVWRVFVFGQDVNLTKPGTPPEIAAQHIGGFFVASAITLTFDPSLPCPMKAQASITVV